MVEDRLTKSTSETVLGIAVSNARAFSQEEYNNMQRKDSKILMKLRVYLIRCKTKLTSTSIDLREDSDKMDKSPMTQ